jgi:hypothetical protein
MKPQPHNAKQHILQHMHHDHHPSRQQLRPHAQILPCFPRNIHLPSKPQDASHDPSSHDLTRPSHHRRIQRQLKVIPLPTSNRNPYPATIRHIRLFHRSPIKSKVRIDVLVRTIVENEDRAEESKHGYGFGQGADIDVAGAEFLIGGERLVVDGY